MDIMSIVTEEDKADLRHIVNGDGTPSTRYLSELRTASMPEVNAISDALRRRLGLRSEISAKLDETALEKCSRPATIAKYPWFSLAHIRDYLRFRTYLNHAIDFGQVLDYFVDLQTSEAISLVKVDAEKLLRPGAFGWRMIATDIRIAPTGLIVEHYMTFGDLIAVNETWLHKVYESWRSRSPDLMTLRELADLSRDERFSRHAYRELLYDGILADHADGSALREGRARAGGAILASLGSTLNLPPGSDRT